MIFVPDSPSLLTVTLLSLYRFFVSILPISVDRLRFWICLFFFFFRCCRFLFQFRFGLFFLHLTGYIVVFL